MVVTPMMASVEVGMVNIMPIWPILGVEAAASCPKKVNHHQKKKEWLGGAVAPSVGNAPAT
jgi:hypothetical protein